MERRATYLSEDTEPRYTKAQFHMGAVPNYEVKGFLTNPASLANRKFMFREPLCTYSEYDMKDIVYRVTGLPEHDPGRIDHLTAFRRRVEDAEALIVPVLSSAADPEWNPHLQRLAS